MTRPNQTSGPDSGAQKDWKVEYDAPAGQVWVCGACGKNGPNRVNIGDESCFLNAVLCYATKDLETGHWRAVDKF
jgi:hypothetical protein